jgi:HAD superfamily hydrolase (TIGR01509 family)
VAPSVLLDLYRTLVEPDWPRLTAGRDAIARHIGVSPEAAHARWTATHANRMRGEYGSLEGDLAAVFAPAQTDSTARIDDSLLAEAAAMERSNWHLGVRLYPDSVPTLMRLRRAGVRSAIVTNSSAEAASVIPDLRLDGLVDLVLASCEAGALKPDLLALALAQLGVEPSDAVLVDDDPDEVAAAERMGMRAFLVRRTADGAPAAADATGLRVITDLSSLHDLLGAAAPGPGR